MTCLYPDRVPHPFQGWGTDVLDAMVMLVVKGLWFSSCQYAHASVGMAPDAVPAVRTPLPEDGSDR